MFNKLQYINIILYALGNRGKIPGPCFIKAVQAWNGVPASQQLGDTAELSVTKCSLFFAGTHVSFYFSLLPTSQQAGFPKLIALVPSLAAESSSPPILLQHILWFLARVDF